MERHFRITVNGKSYDVRVEELGEGAAHASHAPHVAPAHVHGAVAGAAPVAAHAAPASEPDDVLANVGGVVSWIAPAGATLAAGERVATIEAMKTQTPVVAPRAGRLVRVLVAAGDSVEAGQPLATLG